MLTGHVRGKMGLCLTAWSDNRVGKKNKKKLKTGQRVGVVPSNRLVGDPMRKARLALLILFLSSIVFCFVIWTHNASVRVVAEAGIRPSLEALYHRRKAADADDDSLSLCPEAYKRSEFAIVSMLTCARDQSLFQKYQLSSMKLGVSIRMTRSDSDSDMILLMAGCSNDTEGLNASSLKDLGWQLCYVKVIDGPVFATRDANRFLTAGLFSKLNAWLLEEYRAVFLIDSDTLILSSISDIISSLNQRLEAENKSIAAAMQQMTACSPVTCMFSATERCHTIPDTGTGFNAGVMLLKPSRSRFLSLLTSIDSEQYDVNWAEQALLNKIYPKGTYVDMDKGCNFMTFQNPCGRYEWDELLQNVSVVHFTHPKPWECGLHTIVDHFLFSSFSTCKIWEHAPSFIQ